MSSMPAIVVAARWKCLRPSIGPSRSFDRSVILFDQIVKVFWRADLALICFGVFAESLLRRAMWSLITIERDLMRQSALDPESFAKERLGDIPLGAKQKSTVFPSLSTAR
jgi:hypothetical protein